ncbi:hypothetical protein BWQ96_02658 [Gracilariopsis chorda]|uniref:Uncharacterized protein n=1 Tax=Gracilariopsis chorda TaxID=448386 RepID=A0A2V3IZE4_9FLOR|nr:hypothetical protein BWQ96_02658 [Gracilariopsis chorda]|eukprot:PXF47514.1 hypothetical protein BWQ96_02658 [Gracilariopsis chorda]
MPPAANTRSATRARASGHNGDKTALENASKESEEHQVEFELVLSGGKRVPFGRASLPVGKRRRIYAPPPPKPWWRQPPRAAALYKRTDGCGTCDGVRLDSSCERCEKGLCELCTRLCDVCGMTWCTLCSVVDYACPGERTLCLACWDDVGEGRDGDSRRTDERDEVMLSACDVAVDNEEHDGDEDMISLE